MCVRVQVTGRHAMPKLEMYHSHLRCSLPMAYMPVWTLQKQRRSKEASRL